MVRVAEIAAQLIGRPIRRVVVRTRSTGRACSLPVCPSAAADMLVGPVRREPARRLRTRRPALAGLLGRPPTTIEDYLLTSLPS